MIVVSILLLVSLKDFDRCIVAANFYRNGQQSIENNQYDTAINYLKNALSFFPNSATIKVSIAQCYFLNSNNEDDIQGLYHLKGVTISGKQWEKLEHVMPDKYKGLFSTVGRK